MTTNCIAVLQSLCEIEPPEVAGIDDTSAQAQLQVLRDLGALVHVANLDTILCFACNDPHATAVEYQGNGRYRAFCPETGYQPVSEQDLRRWAVSEKWIFNTIASSLGISPALHKSGTLNRIGPVRFGGYRCLLFFGRRLCDRELFEKAKNEISGLLGKYPGILITTTPAELLPGEPPPRCAIVALQDVLRITGEKVSFDDGPILAALRDPAARSAGLGVGFVFSPGYRSVTVGDQEFSFTKKQAEVIELLDKARRSGNPRLQQSEIQGSITSQRLVHLFRGHASYGSLIKHDKAGHYWLDV